MSWQDLFAALALMLVLEGIMPFVNPEKWRRTLQTLIGIPDANLRIVGLACMLIGLGLLYVVRS